MSALVSVVTPCYNHGQYLDDAIQSIPYDKLDYEVEHIIVNDGSTDAYTNKKISELSSLHIKVIQQQNAGLSAARNAGIAVAKGKYIITLDADNKLHENYFTKAIDILEKDNSVDIVYGNMQIFGDENKVACPGELDIIKLLWRNYIDACAVFKSDVFKQKGLYDTQMLHGYEDWDLWLNLFFKGCNFYYLNDIGFSYRVTGSSMLRNISVPKLQEIRSYILKKYAVEITDFFLTEEGKRKITDAKYRYAVQNPVKAFLKSFLKKSE